MDRVALALLISLVGGVAWSQPLPVPAPPPVYAPPIYAPPPVYAPRPVYRPYPVYAPRPYYRPAYVQSYPMNADGRRAYVLRGVGIPLLAVGIPLAVAGGIVAIIGAACESNNTCSGSTLTTGWILLGVGTALFVPGAILLGIGNYYRWASRFSARARFDVAVSPHGGGASLTLRF